MRISETFLIITIVGLMIIFWDHELMLPITAFTSYSLVIIDFLIVRSFIKKDKIFVIFDESNWLVTIFVIVGSIGLIILGVLDKNSEIRFNRIEGKVFMGVFFLLVLVFRKEYRIFITDRAITFGEYLNRGRWRIKKIDKVIIENQNIEFIKGSKKRSILIKDLNKINQIQIFLSKRIGENLIRK